MYFSSEKHNKGLHKRIKFLKCLCNYYSNITRVQLRLINLITGETWDFYLNPSTRNFRIPPELVKPSGMRYCVEVRKLTTEVHWRYTLLKTVVPMEKLYFTWANQPPPQRAVKHRRGAQRNRMMRASKLPGSLEPERGRIARFSRRRFRRATFSNVSSQIEESTRSPTRRRSKCK